MKKLPAPNPGKSVMASEKLCNQFLIQLLQSMQVENTKTVTKLQ
jgi:hypothetical protein